MDTPHDFEPIPVDPEPVGLDKTQRYMLIACGGLAVVAIALALLTRRRSASEWARSTYPVHGADLEGSLRHFVDAADSRFQGMQQQLDALHRAVGTQGPLPHPSPTVAPNGTGAPNLTFEQAIADQPPENTPPGPAAVGLPVK
jgi:hypothetical protein